jgi:carotenoid cleavage dioxygenase-like enzyme
MPLELRVEKNAKDFGDIKSVGYDDFDGQLTHQVSAHPCVDRKTGHFMALGDDRKTPTLDYSLFDKNRKLLSYVKIPIASVRFLHDFAATENFVIIPDLPMELNPKHCVKESKFIYQLNKSKPARYGLFPRFGKSADEIKWFEFPSHYVFHYGNAWEETTDKGELIVILWGCRFDDLDI